MSWIMQRTTPYTELDKMETPTMFKPLSQQWDLNKVYASFQPGIWSYHITY